LSHEAEDGAKCPMKEGIAGKLALDRGRLVSAVVVHQQMHIELLRHCLLDRAQELQAVLPATASVELANDLHHRVIDRSRRTGVCAVTPNCPAVSRFDRPGWQLRTMRARIASPYEVPPCPFDRFSFDIIHR